MAESLTITLTCNFFFAKCVHLKDFMEIFSLHNLGLLKNKKYIG